MSDVMTPMPFGQLMDWILTEHKQSGSIFGVRKIIKHKGGAEPIFSEKIETPFGPAAGPNTQLAQNIVASYVAGSRFFELKTVQIIDGRDLAAAVAKPCIAAGDECYNCEWSTELEIGQAFGEYVKGWWACKLLSRELGLGSDTGFVFNMSVGYDLDGIKSPKVDAYINNMKEAGATEAWNECRTWTLANLDRFSHVDEAFVNSITSHISDSITLSTLHGCPPDEIERIAHYLISEKGVNTYVKCNPTLAGYEYARTRLDSLGFDYIAFDDHHFVEDLQWEDAVPMFHRLMDLAAECGVQFGVKLTNTFPVDVTRNELPSEEMYMSGRSLYPLSVHIMHMIAEEFNGKLRISYAGGADVYSIKQLYGAGVWPITMATTVLKPGGYERFSQIAHVLEGAPHKVDVDAAAAQKIEDSIGKGTLYRKPLKPVKSHKMDSPLPLTDCFTAPCRTGCPLNQDIPAYLHAVDEGDLTGALRIIVERNALPHITGTLCPHPCGDKCERAYYEPDGAHIRASKLKAAHGGYSDIMSEIKAQTVKPLPGAANKRVAVIGGGPAGLATAYFLTRAGAEVTIIERADRLGGVASRAIPTFRIPQEDIDKDIELCLAYGAKVELNREVSDIEELKREGYTDVVVCVGAWAPGHVGLEYGEEHDVLEFLTAARKGEDLSALGDEIVIVGAGNTAMDAARVAKRLPGVKNARIVYRRTKQYMPALEEELQEALDDGVEFLELLAPKGMRDGVLTCERMELGEPDTSGRRSPKPTGEVVEIPATAVICAVGERIEDTMYNKAGVELNRRGCPGSCVTSVDNVWSAGDCSRGPATFVQAIGDAQDVAREIVSADFNKYFDKNADSTTEQCYERKGSLDCEAEPCNNSRCLGCAKVCEVCCDVCPNRANVSITVPGLAQHQIVHMEGMCNECGNCGVFCPWDGRPYKDKLTVFWTADDMADSDNQGFLMQDDGTFVVRLATGTDTYDVDDADCGLPEEVRSTIKTVRDSYGYMLAK